MYDLRIRQRKGESMSRFLADQPSDKPIFIKRDGAYVIKGSDFDDNIPPWLRVSDEYARGYREAENHPEALSLEAIKAICKSRQTIVVLARQYGISHQAISNIRNGKVYKNVA